MKRYAVRITKKAQIDIYQVIDHISNFYKAPITAEKYLIGLYDAIFSLTNLAESIRISTKSDILKYGINARTIIYKKLIIVYTVHGRIVLVKAIISGSLIKS
jgi:plasmid stabilization system protein ParE